MVCGLTARTSTSLRRATSTFASKTSMPVSARKAVRAVSSGSLALIASRVASPARIIPLIRAVAILPEPMKPQRAMRLAILSQSRGVVLRESSQLLPESRPFEHVWVNDILWRLPPGGPEHPLGHRPASGPPDVRGRRRPMRCQEDIVQTEKHIVERERLDLEHVQPGAGDPALAECGRQRCL